MSHVLKKTTMIAIRAPITLCAFAAEQMNGEESVKA
jgi:hypothetical protein